jgi:tetratricopeptide (TPR) repeat protein
MGIKKNKKIKKTLSAAKQTFTSIRSKHVDDCLDDLLHAVDCVPLPVVLLASYGQRGFTTSKLLEIWNEKQTQFLDDGEDRLSNLDASIRLSLDSPLMNARPDALELLTVVAYLPGGIIYDNLEEVAAEIVVPPLIWDVHKAAKTLIDTALVQHTAGVLEVHSTICSYVRHYHPLNPHLKLGLQAFYFQLAEKAGYDQGTTNFSEPARLALSREQRNAEAIILDALKYRADTDTILLSIHYSNYLLWNVPSLEVPRSAVEAIKKFPSPDTNLLLPLCWLRLGKLYIKVDQYSQAVHAMEEAEKGYKQLNQSEGVAKSRYQLAEVHRIRSNYSHAADLFMSAYKEFHAMGSSHDMSSCLRNLGIIHFANDEYPEAVQAIVNAQDTCTPEDDTCLVDCKRELGRVYRKRNTTQAIKLLTEARAYYLVYGPPVNAAMCLYQRSIAHYMQKKYTLADRGLIEAYEDFKHFKNYGQMGYCVYHRAMLNGRRGFLLKALELFEQSRCMFEQMGDPRMDGFSLIGKARIFAVLCRANEAKKIYMQALEKLEKQGADVTRFEWEMQNRFGLCGLVGSRVTLDWYILTITITLFCCVLFLLSMRRRWRLR